jgi:hypothetical protein
MLEIRDHVGSTSTGGVLWGVKVPWTGRDDGTTMTAPLPSWSSLSREVTTMRRLVLAVGAISAIGVSAVLAAMVSTAAAQTNIVPATTSFSLSGSVAGRVKSAELTDQLTFVFTEKNTGTSSSTPPFIVLKSLTDATEENMSCVEPSGFLFQPDGTQCEPGILAAPGQSSSMVLSVTITGTRPATMSAKVCLSNGTTCKTLSVAVL